MEENDFWVKPDEIPRDILNRLDELNAEGLSAEPYGLRVYTIDSMNTNFPNPFFAISEGNEPENEDVAGVLEESLHTILGAGGTPEDVSRIMGLVKESELEPDSYEMESHTSIDLGYCVPGSISSYEAVPESIIKAISHDSRPQDRQASLKSIAKESRDASAMLSDRPEPAGRESAKNEVSI